jgi:hypothetical protein
LGSPNTAVLIPERVKIYIKHRESFLERPGCVVSAGVVNSAVSVKATTGQMSIDVF